MLSEYHPCPLRAENSQCFTSLHTERTITMYFALICIPGMQNTCLIVNSSQTIGNATACCHILLCSIMCDSSESIHSVLHPFTKTGFCTCHLHLHFTRLCATSVMQERYHCKGQRFLFNYMLHINCQN